MHTQFLLHPNCSPATATTPPDFSEKEAFCRGSKYLVRLCGPYSQTHSTRLIQCRTRRSSGTIEKPHPQALKQRIRLAFMPEELPSTGIVCGASRGLPAPVSDQSSNPRQTGKSARPNARQTQTHNRSQMTNAKHRQFFRLPK